jgi:putative FmdB family regulatory protein
MPIYGYACKSCEHTFDVLQKMNDPVLVDCPDCGAANLRKQLSAPKFRLKGKGWYETDFKSGEKRNIAGDTDQSSTDQSSTDKSGGTESKDSTPSKDGDKSGMKPAVKKPESDHKVKTA